MSKKSYHPSRADSTGKSVNSPGRAFFQRFNLFVDIHMRSLPRAELICALIFMRHANVNGIARPGPDRIARVGGMSQRQAKRAIAALTLKGYLETVGWSGPGRGHVANRKIILPEESMTPATPFHEPAIGDARRHKKGDINGAEKVTPATPEHLIEQPKEQQRGEFAAAAAADVRDGNRKRNRELRAELEHAGVGDPMLSKLAAMSHLRPAHIPIILEEIKAEKGIKNIAGRLVDRIRNAPALPRLISPQLLCSLVNDGRVSSIGDRHIHVNGVRATWNGSKITLPAVGDVRAEDLAVEGIGMAVSDE